MSDKLIQILGRPLAAEVRRRFVRATEAMWRDLDYLQGKPDSTTLKSALNAGWPLPRLKAIAVLNAFYRIVLSPMGVATMTNTAVGLGRSVRIEHGSIHLDTASAMALQQAVDAFVFACKALGIKGRWLSAASAGDLAYFVGKVDADSAKD